MGTTITIKNNLRYCADNDLGETITEECQCADFPEMEDCQVCNGFGKISYTNNPFELDICEGNFSMLWNALGFSLTEEDYVGEMYSRIISAKLAQFDPALLVRGSELGKRSFDAGCDQSRADRYLKALKEICDEAERREELIVWH